MDAKIERMPVKLKVSYQTQEDLDLVLCILGDAVKTYKVSRNQQGKYKRAYVWLKSRELSGYSRTIGGETLKT